MNNKIIIAKQSFLNQFKITTKKEIIINICLIIGLSFIGSFVYQNIVKVKIYIPGLYWIPQTITYTLQEQGVFTNIGGPFKLEMLTFYLIGLIINAPLLVFAFFKIGRKYAFWTMFSIIMYTLWGLFFNINDSQLQNFFEKLETHITDKFDGKRATKVEFYLTALVAGVLMGFITSFLWKRNISGGGFDIVYTYLAIKKRRTLSSLTIPVSCVVVILNILLNTIVLKNEKIGKNPIYIFFFIINSAIFAYSYSFVLDYFYPKFAIVTIVIISKQLTSIEKILLKNFKRTATVIKAVGLYEKKSVDCIFITSTFLEKNVVVNIVKKVDPHAFISVWSTQETHGNFFVGFK